jgi:hypothetical protein
LNTPLAAQITDIPQARVDYATICIQEKQQSALCITSP